MPKISVDCFAINDYRLMGVNLMTEVSGVALDNRMIDRIAIIEERGLAMTRDYYILACLILPTFGGLAYWSWQSAPIALLAASSAAFLNFLVFRLMKQRNYLELDRTIFEYRGDMEEMHKALACRRVPNSMLARRRYYFGNEGS
jgi:hypothetical protein